MRFEDALKLMREGRKVWINKGRGKPQHYFYVETDDGSGKQVLMCHHLLMGTSSVLNQLNQDAIMSHTWEEYREPIVLDKQEKEYLENFLRPFTKTYEKIKIEKFSNWIEIYFYTFKEDKSYSDSILFPKFTKDKHMYEGMKLYKCYTLDELGLFEEERNND